MAPKKSSKQQASTKTGSKKSPQPTVYVCPYTNQNVFIGKATLKDLKSKTTYTNTSKRLWILPSPQVRNDLYLEAAKAIATREQSLLPSFGGRSWEVTCKLTEPHWSCQTLFRAWKGKMELAVLPHLLEKIPTPPTWPGRRTQPDEYEEHEEDDLGLQQREISSLSSVAWDLKDSYPIPNVTLKWQSPERKIFHSRKMAWEHATAMASREVEINKCILGIGSSGKLLKPFVPSVSMALKVGTLRFERDGLWVVGQELAWQEGRPQELLDEEQAEEERKRVPKSGLDLFLMSKRKEYRDAHEECTTFKQAEIELRKQWKTLSRDEQREWNKQVRDDEESVTDDAKKNRSMGTEEEEVAEEPQEPEPLKLSMTPQAFYVKSRRHDYREERRAQKRSLSLSECDIWLRQNWKTLDPSIKEEWTQKLIEFETKRAEEEAQAQQKAIEDEQAAAKEKEQINTAKTDVKSERISVVFDLVEVTSNPDAKTPIPCLEYKGANLDYPCGNDYQNGVVSDLILQGDTETARQNAIRNSLQSGTTCADVETISTKDTKELEHIVNDAKSEVIVLSTNRKNSTDETQQESCSQVTKRTVEQPSSIPTLFCEGNSKTQEVCVTMHEGTEHEEEKKEDEVAPKPSLIPSTKGSTSSVVTTSDSPSTNGDANTSNADSDQRPAITPSSMTSMIKKSNSRRSSTKKQQIPTKQATQRWCLNEGQIDSCYDACMDHYETVMRTVKSRDLHRELQDGFDVLRERGFGRYDMELPAFDDSNTFGFLTDLAKAPWMPVVKAILGDDAILIHKGCFLSMPGSAPQEYHQDGVHLTTQTQRPCHAVNVFVPLVDLNSRNGPTEFCVGSHILGLEGYDRDFVEVPKPKAGTPVIFDYRLGHRGLGNNSSRSCRPIVYCTYARATQGKEFRDSVNFSRKRYHKIGELSSKPLSRQERCNKRKRFVSVKEEQDLKRALEESVNATRANSNEDSLSDASNDSSEKETDVTDKKQEEDMIGKQNEEEKLDGLDTDETEMLDVKRIKVHQEAISMVIQDLGISAAMDEK